MTPPEPRGGEADDLHFAVYCAAYAALRDYDNHPDGDRGLIRAGDQRIPTLIADEVVKTMSRRPSPPVVHGWPEREAVARIVNPKAWSKFDRFSGYADHVSRVDQIAWSQHQQPSLKTADAVLALFPPVVGWRVIETHDGSKEPVLLIGLYRDGKTWSDVYHGWWQPPFTGVEGDQCDGRWARWPHPFPPTHFQPINTPALPAAPLTDGVG